MNYTEKSRKLYSIYGGICPICHGTLIIGQYELHHGGVHNTKGNNKNYKLFSQSLANLYPLHRACHSQNPSFGHVTETTAEAIETALANIRNIRKNITQSQKLALIEEIKSIL